MKQSIGFSFFILLLSSILVTGCIFVGVKPGDDSSTGKGTVTVQIKTEEADITVKDASLKVKKGAKWQEIKSTVRDNLSYDKTYEVILRLATQNGKALEPEFLFNTDTVIWATWQMVTLTIKDDKPSVELKGPDSMKIKKNTRWNMIKDGINKRVVCEIGLTIGQWKLDDGYPLMDNFLFQKDTTITVTKRLDDACMNNMALEVERVVPPYNGIEGTDTGVTSKLQTVFGKGRTVYLTPYRIGKTEVTYKLWKEVYDWALTRSYRFAHKGVNSFDYKPDTADSSEADRYPVTEISWYDCLVWCNAYTEKTSGNTNECVYRTKNGILKDATAKSHIAELRFDNTKKGFRLPTEAEWEYAARYTDPNNTKNADRYGSIWLTKLDSASGASANTKDPTETAKVAWYASNTSISMELGTHPVGKKRANVLGLCDMSGNLAEWCFDRRTNRNSIEAEKGEHTDPTGPATGDYRVVRGGAYNSLPDSIAIGDRSLAKADDKTNTITFRVVCTP